MTSGGLYIPLIWVMIVGTRAVSMWFAGESLQIQNLDDYLEGSPLDRNVFILLIISGLYVLFRRHAPWKETLKSNAFFLVFLIFCGVSCIWSSYAATAFKRYMKDIGNVIMVLIIMSETKPLEAVRAILCRYAYVAISFSLLFIRYFPELGRYYNRWTYQPVFCGIATEKNALGQVAFISGIVLIWDLLNRPAKDGERRNNLDTGARILLLVTAVWLLFVANSSTSVFCMILGAGILFGLQTRYLQNQVRNLGAWSLLAVCIVAVIYLVPGVLDLIVGFVGRDVTLTGRTDLWRELIAQPINPLLGSGFQSFWQTPEAARLGERFYFIPNQAHNSLVEIYIQTGLIGLTLFVGSIIAAGKNLKLGIMEGEALASLLLPLFVTVLVNNWTEASVNKPNLVWLLMILVFVYNARLIVRKDDHYPTLMINDVGN